MKNNDDIYQYATGLELRRLRKRWNLTIRDVARLFGVAKRTIYNWETVRVGIPCIAIACIRRWRCVEQSAANKSLLKQCAISSDAKLPDMFIHFIYGRQR